MNGRAACCSTLVVRTYLQLQLISVWSTEKPILVDPLALNNYEYDEKVSCCPACISGVTNELGGGGGGGGSPNRRLKVGHFAKT